MTKIFDAHTHAFPAKIAKTTLEALSSRSGAIPHTDGTIPGLLDYERAAAACLLLPIATRPHSVRTINEWAAAHVSDRLLAFGSLHPDSEDLAGDLRHLRALGLRGVKLHPHYQGFPADDAHLYPLYDAVFGCGLPLCLHAGLDPGFPGSDFSDVRRIATVAEDFPHGRIIAAHLGGFEQLRDVFEQLAGRPNVWMDTSYAAERTPPQDIRRLVRAHGATQFFFGTDAPWADFAVSRDALLTSGLSEAVLRDIFWNNAAAFFGLDDIAPAEAGDVT